MKKENEIKMLTETDAYLFGFFALIIVEAVLFIRKVGTKRKVMIGLFVVYITLALSVTLFPIPFQEIYLSGYEYNFIPFKSIADSINSGLRLALTSVAGNVILTMPFGFLITLLKNNKKFLNVLIFVVAFSLAIELTQLVIGIGIGYRYRNVDIDDLILNTAGGIIGYAIYKLAPRKILNIFE